MASGKIKGITVEIGGDTTKLGKAISNVEKQSNSLKGELKQVEKLLKMDPGNADLMAQKQEILARAVSETSEKLKILKEAQSQVEAQFKNGDIGEDQYRAFQREIIKTENELDSFRSELDGTGDDLKDVGKSAETSSDGFTIMKGALADMVANVITSAISSIDDLIGSLLELSEATEEYRTMQAKLEGSANTFGYSLDFANGKYQEFYKYVGDDQMATNAITNLMGLGTSTENVTDLANGAIAVWSAYGDSIPIEALTESINETAQVGKVTGNLADALNWAGVSEDEFNKKLEKCKTTQERADLIAKTLNETYGDSKTTYDEMAGSILDANEAELKLKESQAQLGEAVAPVNTAITNLKSQALEAILPVVEKVGNAFLNLLTWLKEHPTATKVLTAVVIALATAFGVLAGALAIQGIITGVTKAIAFLNTTLLANPIVLIIALITGLVAGFIYLWNNCDAFREFWINLWKKIQTAFEKTWNTVKTFVTKTIPQIINNVINWFKQLPTKIATWLTNTIKKITTWASDMKKKATDTGKNFINSIVNFFKTLPGKVWTFLVNVVTKIVTWRANMIKKAVEVGTQFVSKIVSKVKEIPSKVYNSIKGAVSKVKSWGSSLASTAGSAISKMASKIVSTAKSIPGKMVSIGKEIINGIKRGISGAIGGLYSSIKSSLSGLVKKAKNALGIKSPSRVFRDEVGRYISEGIGTGIVENEDSPLEAIAKVNDDMIDKAGEINGATINRKLTTTFNAGSAELINDNASLLSKLDSIYERLNHLQIVLDTGTLVGETIDKIDAGLGSNYALRTRGV